MINLVFGKTVENNPKHTDIRLIKSTKILKQYSSQPNYYDSNHFSENLIALEMWKTQIFLNKPIAIRFIILEFS